MPYLIRWDWALTEGSIISASTQPFVKHVGICQDKKECLWDVSRKRERFHFRPGFLLEMILSQMDIGQYLGTSVVVTVGVLLASRGWGPWMLLSSLPPPQCFHLTPPEVI